MDTISEPLYSPKLLAEYFPKLSIVNVYVNFGVRTEFLKTIPKISVKNSCIFVSVNDSESKFSFSFEGLRFAVDEVNELPKFPQTIQNNLVHFRVIVKPEFISAGSHKAEVLSLDKSKSDQQNDLFKLSQNRISLKENEPYSVHCRSCDFALNKFDLIFDKIRQLPGSNWAERANEMWFCHPPGPDSCHKSGENSCGNGLANELNRMTLSSRDSRNIFEILSSPDLRSCFYGPTYWLVNSKIVDSVVPNVNNPTVSVCPNCEAEIGIFGTENAAKSVQLWDFGVVWKTKCETLENIGDLPLLNFKTTIFSCIYDTSVNLNCKVLVKSVSSQNSLILWSMESDTVTYLGSFENPDSENILISPKRLIKFLFLTNIDDKPLEYPWDVSEFDSQVTIPQKVFQAGVSQLLESSTSYLTDPNSFKCGYLDF